MDSRRSNKPSASFDPAVVTAPTLKEAYKRVRSKYGANAVILGSRSVTRRQALGLGREKLVEVLVQKSETRGTATLGRPTPPQATTQPISRDAAPTDTLTSEIAKEVDRIEALVRGLTENPDFGNEHNPLLQNNPLAETLIASGTTPQTVTRLLTRFSSETGQAATDRPAALSWLIENLKASNCQWDGFFGCHAILGYAGAGRSSLVMAAAARLQKMGRRTLVLTVTPSHRGEIRRLQVEASEHGYDAAVIQKPEQLPRSESHLSKYDAVLLDMPSLEHESMAEGGALHTWLATNPGFHRHLLTPLHMDVREYPNLGKVARSWNCDWVALSHLDRCTFPGKIFNLLEDVPLPISLTTTDALPETQLSIAQSGALLDHVLAAGGSAATELNRQQAQD